MAKIPTNSDGSSGQASTTEKQITEDDAFANEKKTSKQQKTTDTTADVPDDLNAGRRTSRNSNTGNGDSSSSSGGGDIPDDVNAGRRTSRNTNTDNTGNGEFGGTQPPVNEQARRAAGLGNVSQGDSTSRTEQQIRGSIAEQAVQNNPDLTSREQVRVRNVEQTEEGFTGDVVLTESGREAVQEGTEDAIDRMGTTGRRFQTRQQEIEQSRTEAAFAEDARTNQFARRRLREQFAGQSENLQSSDIDLDFSGGNVDVGLTVGGRSRALIRTAAESSDFEAGDLEITTGENGLDVRATDEALRQRAAEQNPEFSSDDFQVRESQPYRYSDRRFGVDEDQTVERVELTDDAQRREIREQIEEEYPNAEYEIQQTESGDFQVEFTERFDDEGRFLLIPGGEAVVEGAGQAIEGGVNTVVTTSSKYGTGAFLDNVVSFGGDIAGVETPDTRYRELSESAGRGVGDVANFPQLFATADEIGEVIGEGAAAGVQRTPETNIGFSVDAEGLSEFSGEAAEAGKFFGNQVWQQIEDDPAAFGARVGAATIASAGLFAATSASSVAGQTARGLIQPGEEALAAAGLRPSTVARSAISRGRSAAGNISTPNVRPEVNLGSISEARARAPNIRLGRGEGFVNVQEGVGQSTREAVSSLQPSITRTSRSQSGLAKRIQTTRSEFETRARQAAFETEVQVAAAKEAVRDFDIRENVRRPTVRRPAIKERVEAEATSAALNAEVAFFNAKRRVSNVDAPSLSGARSEASGAIRGGVLSAEAAAFNARRRLADAGELPDVSPPSGAEIRSEVRGAVQGTALSTEAAVFNTKRAVSEASLRPDFDRPSIDRPDVRGAVEGRVQGAALSTEAAVFNARRSIGDASLPDPKSRLSGVTELRLEVEPGRPPKQSRVIDTQDLGEVDVDFEGNESSIDLDSPDTGGDIEVSKTESEASTGTVQQTVQKRRDTGVGRPEGTGEFEVDRPRGIQRFEPSAFDSTPAPTIAEQEIGEQDIQLDAGERELLFEDADQSLISDQESSLGQEFAVDPALDSSVEMGMRPSQSSRVDTGLEQEVAFDTATETETESAIETEFATEGDGRRRLDLDLDSGKGPRRGRSFEFGGDEQRFDYGDIELR